MNTNSKANIALVLGGARSGKSAFAEQCARNFSSVVYFATAQRVAGDKEMDIRIAKHRQRRPESWRTFEPPQRLDDLVRHQAESPSECVIIDCATLWLGWELTQVFQKYSKEQLLAHMENEIAHFVAALEDLRTHVIVVSSETGCGVVPEHASGRIFRDMQGLLNNRIAEKARLVCAVMAGQPLIIKRPSEPGESPDLLPIARATPAWLAGALR